MISRKKKNNFFRENHTYFSRSSELVNIPKIKSSSSSADSFPEKPEECLLLTDVDEIGSTWDWCLENLSLSRLISLPVTKKKLEIIIKYIMCNMSLTCMRRI